MTVLANTKTKSTNAAMDFFLFIPIGRILPANSEEPKTSKEASSHF